MVLEKRRRRREEAIRGGGEQSRLLRTRAGAFSPGLLQRSLVFVRIAVTLVSHTHTP